MKKKILTSIAVIFLICGELFAAGPKLGLVLSGGGARGLAHIAVIRELEERGLYPDVVVGTSMGALVGAFYSAGYTADQIEDLITNTDMVSLFMHIYTHGVEAGKFQYGDDLLSNIASIDFSMQGLGASNGVIDDQEVAAFLRTNLARVLPIKDFNDLSTPFACMGADLVSGEKIKFDSGNLFTAIRSSMSLPIFFTPVYDENGERYIIDGGIADNLPCDIAREMGADIVLAVDVNDSADKYWDSDKAALDTLSGTISQFMDLTTKFNSIEQYENADYILVPHLNGYRTMEFWRYEDILRLGEECVEENERVFEKLEREIRGRKEAPLNYFDRPFWTIESFVYPGLDKYSAYFDSLKGREATEELMASFESMLQYIKEHERLKSIRYEVFDGLVYIDAEPYEELSSSLSIGLGGDLGLSAGLWGGDRGVNFYASPHFSLFADMGFGAHPGSLLFGLNSTDLLNMFAGYYYPITRNVYVYGSLMSRLGAMRMLAMPKRVDMIDSLDFSLGGEAGFVFGWQNEIDLSFTLGFDYVFLGALKTLGPVDTLSRESFPVPTFGFSFNYRGRDNMNLFVPGARVSLEAEIMLWNELMYTLDFSFDASAPAVGRTIFFISGNAMTSRGEERLASSYTTNRRGHVTRDYAELELGGRILISEHMFLDVAGFAEGYENKENYYDNKVWTRRDPGYTLIPFAMMNDFEVGLSIGFGLKYESLSLILEMGLSHRGTATLSLTFL